MVCVGSNDYDVKLWDIRSSKDPLFALGGHHMMRKEDKAKGMHRALFVAGGQYVVCSGDKSKALSMYNTLTGATVSRGEIGVATTCAVANDATRQVAVSGGKHVVMYALTPAKA